MNYETAVEIEKQLNEIQKECPYIYIIDQMRLKSKIAEILCDEKYRGKDPISYWDLPTAHRNYFSYHKLYSGSFITGKFYFDDVCIAICEKLSDLPTI